MVLNVENLRVEFAGGLTAIQDVSFSIGEGEILGIVGESGCGKSVTCMSLLGLLPPTARIVSGHAKFGHEDLLALDGRRLNTIRGRRISYIFQDSTTSLNPVIPIGRQIMEPMIVHQAMPRKAARARAVELLGRVGVSDPERRMGNYPHQFSGGMNQRVMIAMALACRPDLLIADEPTTALDVTIQAQILDLLYQLSRESGTAIILVTHDLGVIAEMADRIAIMYSGRIVEAGKTRDVFRQPRHPYTRGLLDSRLRIDRRIERLQTIEGSVPSLAERIDGCNFAPRCSRARSECRQRPPPFEVIGSGHAFACFNPSAAA
ncbi:MAG: ABC transporter ATP-binding protein [Alphaproteobacteria bacterium]